MGWDGVRFPAGSVFLVTGGAGFIGSHLCAWLVERGYDVRCLDDLSTGSYANVEPLLGCPNFTYIGGSITDPRTCADAVKGVRYVLHQAAWGSVPRSIEQPVAYEDVNIRGTLLMMEAARRAGVSKFVYASSSSVYGDEPSLPKREGREGRVLAPYALTKRVNEEYGRLYTQLYGLDTYGLRYFNVFGPRQDPDGPYAAVIPRFARALLRGDAAVVNGDGTNSRDFTYVDNVVEANLKACLAPHEAAGRAYNIAAAGRASILEVYRALAAEFGSDAEPRFGPSRQGDIPHSFADIAAAREAFGYDPSFSFEEGLARTAAWYRKELMA